MFQPFLPSNIDVCRIKWHPKFIVLQWSLLEYRASLEYLCNFQLYPIVYHFSDDLIIVLKLINSHLVTKKIVYNKFVNKQISLLKTQNKNKIKFFLLFFCSIVIISFYS